MDVSKLYPEIEFPVSRGTPMISSLIRWDHSEDFFYMKHEDKILNSERTFPMILSEPDCEYLSGHTIDGQSSTLFPLFFTKIIFLYLQEEFCTLQLVTFTWHGSHLLT